MAVGKFITLEGGEGTGKSTQAALLSQRLNESGHVTLVTREPGGSEDAEKIREFLLSGKAEKFGAAGEAVLFYTARDDHLERVIRPALDAGRWVVCDRFSDSTRAYQGAAGGVKPTVLKTLDRLIVADTQPDLTIVLDLPVKEGLRRALGNDNEGNDKTEADYFESMDIGFHEALRRRFQEIAREEPDRCVVVDATLPPSAVAEDIWEIVVERLAP